MPQTIVSDKSILAIILTVNQIAISVLIPKKLPGVVLAFTLQLVFVDLNLAF